MRAFAYTTFDMMSKAKNDDWIARRVNGAMLAYALDVDFEIAEAINVYDPRWLAREELRAAGAEKWGVLRELHVKPRRKIARQGAWLLAAERLYPPAHIRFSRAACERLRACCCPEAQVSP